MYQIQTTQAQTDQGDTITIEVMHVDIDPDDARRIFAEGQEVGDWGWKHKVWKVYSIEQLGQVQAAARFFYGWAEGSEKLTACADGYIYQAWYAC